MSITLKQASGSLVTPTDDAKMYNLFLNNQVGIVAGCTITHLGSNQLKITAGWGICQGRQFVIEEEIINATVASSGTVNGRLLIHIDTSLDAPVVFFTQAAATLPDLTQEDINGTGAVYEIELATYSVNEIVVSNLVTTYPKITGLNAEKLEGKSASEFATAEQGAKADNAVPKTTTVNGKALKANISLTCVDIGAATAAQGTKADNAMPKTGGRFESNVTFSDGLTDKQKLSMKLLWVNASPTSSFAAQTIGLDLSGYDLIYYIQKNQADSDATVSSLIKVGNRAMSSAPYNSVQQWRDITVRTTGVTIGNGRQDATTNNAVALPFQIYGIKGVQ